ncbi:MAG TPA: hypothetical protein VFL27_03670 [Candidatus Dormibacteraeota bacterium]|nr:hypothetical protein [Candidatus Dormibacteraeota bacterium]
MAENVAGSDMYLASLQQWEIRLVSYGIAAAIGLVAALVIQRAQRNAKKPATTVDEVRHSAEAATGAIVGVYGLVIVASAAILVLSHAPLWIYALGVPIVVWAGWWLVPRNRQIVSQASILVQGLPNRVSAFVADVPGHVRWSPGVISCVPDMAGSRGPRFRGVQQTPDGRQVGGVVELTRDEPGVEVDLVIVGAGASGDYYSFVAAQGGTLVTQKTVVQLPYVLALAGGMLMARGDDLGAHQRRVNELQALKTAFESGQ